MPPIPDNSRRARLVIVFFWVLLGIEILYYILNYFYPKFYIVIVNFLADLIGIQIPSSWILSSIGISDLFFELLGVVFFLLWFRQAYHNLSYTGYSNRYKNGWAIAGWFIPFANFILPYNITKEIWDRTQRSYTSDTQGSVWVILWWMLFVCSVSIYEILFEELTRRSGFWGKEWYIFREILRILSMIFTLVLVYKISSFERRMRQHLMVQGIGHASLYDADSEDTFYPD